MGNVWLERRIIAYAHQGGSFERPSSTLAAIEYAKATGATGIELDVHATKDRELVVCHDHTIDRTTNSHGEIALLTLAELRALDNAYWFIEGEAASPGHAPSAYHYRGRAPDDRAYGLATLAEVLDATPGVLINLDIKRTAPEVEPYEQLLIDQLRSHHATDRVIVGSFSDAAIKAFRAVAPEVPTSAATEETAAFYFGVRSGQTPPPPPVVAFQVPDRFGDIPVVDAQFVDAAHAAGIAVHVWTINDAPTMSALVDLGVDGIMSDVPSVLVPLLNERGVAWDGRL